MSKIYFTLYSTDEVSFFIDFIKNNIAAYQLGELTNGHCGDVPSINNAHPLAMEYGSAISGNDDNYTSMLPAIGVELISDPPAAKGVLGKGKQVIEITQSFIDSVTAVPLKDRFKDGKLISDTNLTALQAALTAASPDKLYGYRDKDIQEQSINISIWTNDFTVTRTVYLVMRALLHRADHAGSAVGLKNMKINGVNGLYNYDFSETLYGGEFNITFNQQINNVEVDTDISSIVGVEEHTKTGQSQNEDVAGVTGVGIGE